MPYNAELLRAVLLMFGMPRSAAEQLSTDGVIQSPPIGTGNSEEVPEHVDRLVDVGLLRRTNEIHMKNHPDPVTLRVTEAGRPWVRRAYDDDAWAESLPALQHLLEDTDR